MASAVRYIASDTQAEIIKQHTRPSSLVKITFGNVTLLLCEGADILWGSDLYIGSSVRVGSFKWTPDGDHSGEVVLMNDRSDASALILGNDLQDAQVWIYQTYISSVEVAALADLTRVLSEGQGRALSEGGVRTLGSLADAFSTRISDAGDPRVTQDTSVRITQEDPVPSGGVGTPVEVAVFTTPELLVYGVLDGVNIGYGETTLSVYMSKAKTEFVPNRFFAPGVNGETVIGFNHLPKAGTVMWWGTEKFVLEAES